MTTQQEAAVIRSQLRLRWNTTIGCYEVYTTIHGSGVFRWFTISEEVANWYHSKFNLTAEPAMPTIDQHTGAFTSYQSHIN